MRHRIGKPNWAVVGGLLLVGVMAACSRESGSSNPSPPASARQALEAQGTDQPVAAVQPASGPAVVGKPAPAFTLPDLNGTPVSLSDYLGKKVVLEWFNPECPFVKKAHTKGSLVSTPQKHIDSGVAWLAINSGGPGRQGHGPEATRAGKKEFDMRYPILADADGNVGHAYGAERTPHIYIIDERGVLRYRGAIDNSPDGELQSPTGGQVVNYADQALTEMAAGKPVSIPETKAYGCGVKYAGG